MSLLNDSNMLLNITYVKMNLFYYKIVIIQPYWFDEY